MSTLHPVTAATKDGYLEIECVHRLGDYAVCRYAGDLSIVHTPTGAALRRMRDSVVNAAFLQSRLKHLHADVSPFDMRTYHKVVPQLRVALGFEEVTS